MISPRLKQAAVVTVAVATLTLLTGRSLVFAAQTPAATPPPSAGQSAPPPEHQHPAPTNLKVLPKDLTGEQVHEIMHQWSGDLGTGCKTCHAASKELGPDGKPKLNFADDSKEDKQTARLMYTMMEDINANYVAKVPNSGAPVTCGTCHRGHLGPEPFVPAPEKEHAH
jgi:hypothetical protein